MRSRAWRPSALASEAARNVAAGGGRTCALVVVVAAGLLASGAWELRSIADARSAESALVARGSAAVRVEPAEGELGIDAQACIALDHRPGIRAAGPVWNGPGLRTPATGDRTITAITASGGAIAALTGDDRGGPPVRAVLATPLADELALGVGDDLVVDVDAGRARLPVGAVAELGRRRPDLDAAVAVVGVRPDPASECWISLEPAVESSLLVAVTGSFPGEVAPKAVLVVPPDDLLRSPEAELDGRSSRLGGAAAGLVIALTWSALLWGRRSEVGLYRSFGVGRIGAVVLVWCELVVALAAGAAVATFAGLGVGLVVGREMAGWAVGPGVVAIGTGLVAGAIAGAALTRAAAADLLKG